MSKERYAMKYTCKSCGSEESSLDWSYKDRNLFWSLKEIELCEECARKRGPKQKISTKKGRIYIGHYWLIYHHLEILPDGKVQLYWLDGQRRIKQITISTQEAFALRRDLELMGEDEK